MTIKVSAYGTNARVQLVLPPLSDCSNVLNCKLQQLQTRLLQLINVYEMSLSLVNWQPHIRACEARLQATTATQY